MAYRGVLFDLDGTLLNTIELIVCSYRHTFRECLGLDVPRRDVLARIGWTLPAHLALYRPDPQAVAEMTEVYRRFNLANHDRLARLFPGVRETLAALARAGIRLGVVSSKIRVGVERGLELFDLTRYFRTVICLEDTERHKPDPEPVALGVRRLGLEPGQVVMVGDSPSDLEAGRRAGTGTAAVAWSTFSAEELEAADPDHFLSAVEDLLPLCGVD